MSTEDEVENEWSGGEDPLADPDERAYLLRVVDSFRQYRRCEHFNITHVRRQAFYALPQSHWQRLAAPPISFLDTLCKVDDAIAENATIAEAVHAAALTFMGLPSDQPGSQAWGTTADADNHAKARSTINQLYRDWSAEGATERAAVFKSIFEDLKAHKASNGRRSDPLQVLVPGAGLARFVFELSLQGYAAEGNEVSYHQLLTSSLMLNHASEAGQWTLHPFVGQFSNARSRADQLRAVKIPDVCPTQILAASKHPTGSMQMSAGDFCDVYGPSGARAAEFDAVATVFFIDTAPDLIKYIETVRHCLKVGGIWTNVGPLLWHFEPPAHNNESNSDQHSQKDSRKQQRIGDHGCVQLAHDEVIELVEQFGFKMKKIETDTITTGYIANERSLLESMYKPVHWVAERQANL